MAEKLKCNIRIKFCFRDTVVKSSADTISEIPNMGEKILFSKIQKKRTDVLKCETIIGQRMEFEPKNNGSF